MGFLADSYAIFSPNVVSPALAYIYWPTDTGGEKGMIINLVTLAGSCIGMMLFGWLADVLGRSRLYGVELVIGIIATLGLTQVSAGFNQESMNAFGWIIWWRLVLGVAIGAEYPLSALIAAEWSATRKSSIHSYPKQFTVSFYMFDTESCQNFINRSNARYSRHNACCCLPNAAFWAVSCLYYRIWCIATHH
jgi:MFS family permease